MPTTNLDSLKINMLTEAQYAGITTPNPDELFMTGEQGLISRNTGATGVQARTEGNTNKAIGDYSHAEGKNTLAGSIGAHAEGIKTFAKGYSIPAAGSSWSISGINTFDDTLKTVTLSSLIPISTGETVTIIRANDFLTKVPVIGVSGRVLTLSTTEIIDNTWMKVSTESVTITTPYSAHAEGENTTATARGAHAEGWGANAYGQGSHAEGTNTNASYINAHAEGWRSLAGGKYRESLVYRITNKDDTTHKLTVLNLDDTVPSGFKTGYWLVFPNTPFPLEIAEVDGNVLTLTADTAIPMGNYCIFITEDTKLNAAAHAEGSYTIAWGCNSHAEGSYTIATGIDSHAEGSSTIASGHSSHSQNSGTIAQGLSQTAIGAYNIPQGSKKAKVNSDYLFIIGNGNDNDTRSNAMTLTWDGTLNVAKGFSIGGIPFKGGAENLVDGNAEGAIRTKGAKSDYQMAPYSFVTGKDTTSLSYGGVVSGANNYDLFKPVMCLVPTTVDVANKKLTFANDTTETLSQIKVNDYATQWYNGDTGRLGGTQSKILSVNVDTKEIVLATSGFAILSIIDNNPLNNSIVINSISNPGTIMHPAYGYSFIEGIGNMSCAYNTHIEGTKNIAIYGTPLKITNKDPIAKQLTVTTLKDETTISVIAGDTFYARGGTGKAPNTYSVQPKQYTITNVTGNLLTFDTTDDITTWTHIVVISSTIPPNYGSSSMHVEGRTNIVTAYGAHAEGSGSIAAGSNSHAEGTSIATGNTAHSEGTGTVSSGYASHAEGGTTRATNSYSHAEGNNTQALGDASHAEGSNGIAYGSSSHAEGVNTAAIANTSHAEGSLTMADVGKTFFVTSASSTSKTITLTAGQTISELTVGTNINIIFSRRQPLTLQISAVNDMTITVDDPKNLFAINEVLYVVKRTDNGESAHAEGLESLAFGKSSHAEGFQTRAFGNQSHAEGYMSISIGYGSHAEGSATTSTGNKSHAEGESSKAIGENSHAEGQFTQAIGGNSHAEGSETIAFDAHSHSEGKQTIAKGFASHAEGESTSALTDRSHAEGLYSTATSGVNYNIISFDNTAKTLTLSAVNELAVGNKIAVRVKGSKSIDDITILAISDKTITIDTTQTIYGAWTHIILKNNTLNTSHAEGLSTFASSSNAHAEGSETEATGIASHAEGNATIASGYFSHAEGNATKASGYSSHAEGWNTTASSSSHAEGVGSTASGSGSHAEGSNTIASGDYSHAQNNTTIAQGLAQTTIGAFNIAQGNASIKSDSDYVFIVGNGTSGNTRSNAMTLTWDGTLDVKKNILINGQPLKSGPVNILDSNATGSVRTIGSSTGPMGEYSFAEGKDTTVTGHYSHAEGLQCNASGMSTHAEGSQTTASGSYSHSEGSNTTASGDYSHAEGDSTRASGRYSHSAGHGTMAQGYGQTVIGEYNIAQGTATSKTDTDYALIVGNGTSSARSNAMTLTWDGTLDVKKGVTINGQPVSTRLVLSTTLVAANWTTSAPYTYTATVAGILSTDLPHVGINYSATLATAKLEKAAYGKIDDIDATADNTIVFRCFDEKPTQDLNLTLEVFR